MSSTRLDGNIEAGAYKKQIKFKEAEAPWRPTPPTVVWISEDPGRGPAFNTTLSDQRPQQSSCEFP